MTWFMRLTWEGVGMHVGILLGTRRRTVAFDYRRRWLMIFTRR